MPEDREQARSVLEHAYLIDAIEQADDVGETRARPLDAAHGVFCRLGVADTSMQKVARGAGLSRVSASFRTVGSRIVDIADDVRPGTVARQFLVPTLEPRR